MPPRDARAVMALAAERYNALAAYEHAMALKVTEILKQLTPYGLKDSWISSAVVPVVNAVTVAQVGVVSSASDYVAASLAAQGSSVEPDAELMASGFVGTAASGEALADPFSAVIGQTVGDMAQGASIPESMARMQVRIIMVAQTEVRQAALNAETVAGVTRHSPGYVRFLRPPSCSRCAVLAGRVYSHSHGFQRHPRCDCGMIPAPEGAEFNSDKMVDRTGGAVETLNPIKYFESLDASEQDSTFGVANSQLIRAGADPAQVVNATRNGATYDSGKFTREGLRSTQGGAAQSMWRDYLANNPQAFATEADKLSVMSRYLATRDRLTPTEIVRRSGGDQSQLLRLLKLYGYV